MKHILDLGGQDNFEDSPCPSSGKPHRPENILKLNEYSERVENIYFDSVEHADTSTNYHQLSDRFSPEMLDVQHPLQASYSTSLAPVTVL